MVKLSVAKACLGRDGTKGIAKRIGMMELVESISEDKRRKKRHFPSVAVLQVLFAKLFVHIQIGKRKLFSLAIRSSLLPKILSTKEGIFASGGEFSPLTR